MSLGFRAVALAVDFFATEFLPPEWADGARFGFLPCIAAGGLRAVCGINGLPASR